MTLYIQLITSFIVGGLFIAMQTLIGERVPLRWRGVALTAPTTMALSLFFVGLTKSPQDITEMSLIIPAAIAPDYIFILIFAILSRFGLVLSLAISYIVWGILGYTLLQFPPETFAESVFLYAAPVVIITYLIIRKLPQVTNLKTFPMNSKHILIRSLLGGTIILTVVILAKTVGNFWGGLFSMFPTSFLATFIIYYTLQGRHVMPSVAKSLFWPGIPGFIIYLCTAILTFPEYGIWIGTLLSYLATFAFFWAWVKVGMLTLPHPVKQPPDQSYPHRHHPEENSE